MTWTQLIEHLTKAIYAMWTHRYAAEVPSPLIMVPAMMDDSDFEFPGPVIVDLGQLAVVKGCIDKLQKAHEQELQRAYVAGHLEASSYAGWWNETTSDREKKRIANEDFDRWRTR